MTPTPLEERRAERLAAIKAQRRRNKTKKYLTYAGIGALIAGAVVGVCVLAAVVFQVILWNLGVVGLTAACGASVAKIGFWTAFGGVFLGTYLSGLLHGSASTVSNTTNKIKG